MTTFTIKCSKCKGTGLVKGSGVFADTYKLLRRQRAEKTGAELARIAGCKPTAMNNRLVWLEHHGMAVGRAYGRSRYWTAEDSQ